VVAVHTFQGPLADVLKAGIELAECASDLFSDASAAAVTCTIAKDVISPPHCGRSR